MDSVFYALQAIDTPIIWIVGGVDKGNDYGATLEIGVKKVKAIVCIGLDNSKIISVFGEMKKAIVQTDAKSAVKASAA